MRRSARRAAGLALLAVTVTGCVGPTTTDSAVRRQARLSAEAAASEVATADLAVRTQRAGDAWWSYTDVAVTAAENAASTVEQTFVSRQPPRTSGPLYTRTGDAGTTGLGDGSRVSKASVRIDAIGSVDETNSAIGVLLAESIPDDVRACLLDVQHGGEAGNEQGQLRCHQDAPEDIAPQGVGAEQVARIAAGNAWLDVAQVEANLGG